MDSLRLKPGGRIWPISILIEANKVKSPRVYVVRGGAVVVLFLFAETHNPVLRRNKVNLYLLSQGSPDTEEAAVSSQV
jgi:hypothetical protein